MFEPLAPRCIADGGICRGGTSGTGGGTLALAQRPAAEFVCGASALAAGCDFLGVGGRVHFVVSGVGSAAAVQLG